METVKKINIKNLLQKGFFEMVFMRIVSMKRGYESIFRFVSILFLRDYFLV